MTHANETHRATEKSPLTVNGFTEEFENHVLTAEKSGLSECMVANEAVGLLRKIMNEGESPL